MAQAGRTERDIVNEFQHKRAMLQETWSKISELANETAEHELVIRTLEPMDANRKCFRLVGEVLVERTVAETLPAVKAHKKSIEEVIKTLQEKAKQQETDLAEFQKQYKIKIRNSNEPDEPQPSSSKPSGSAQGVLVSQK